MSGRIKIERGSGNVFLDLGFGKAEARGEPLPVIDALIAATGEVHGLEVVTRNTADLERCGARCVNPWSRAPSP